MLFVDDEPSILASVRRCLRREPYQVLLAGSAAEGMQILESRRAAEGQAPLKVRPALTGVAVVVSDQRMPEVSGSEFLARVREKYPSTTRIILTGQSDIRAAIDAINEGEVYRYLTKPWDDDELKAVLRDAVERFDLTEQNRELGELTLQQNEELGGLNARLRNAITESLTLLTGLLELRSSTVGAHSTRVALLSRRLSSSLGLDEAWLMDVAVAATLHDIGKVGMPDRILRRPPDMLTSREREMLGRHPVLGEGMARRVHAFSRAATMVRHHHENCDGSGYPDGLVRKDIPLGARIVAVADAYDHELNSREAFRAATPERAWLAVGERAPDRLDPEILARLRESVSGGGDGAGRNAEVGLRLSEVEPGMILARNILNTGGVMLLPKGTRVTGDLIERLKAYGGPDVLLGGVFVKRSAQMS